MESTRRCPYCAEDILAAAIKCKHCGSDLTKAPAPSIAESVPPVIRPVFRVLGGLIVAAVILIVLWHPSVDENSEPAAPTVADPSGPDLSAAPINTPALAGSNDLPPAAPDSTDPVYRTTAVLLYQAYEANEVATDQKIGRLKIEVRGTIHAIDKDFLNHVVIRLDTGNEFSTANLTLIDSQNALAASLAKEQPISILCRKMRRIVGSPAGSDCEIEGRAASP